MLRAELGERSNEQLRADKDFARLCSGCGGTEGAAARVKRTASAGQGYFFLL